MSKNGLSMQVTLRTWMNATLVEWEDTKIHVRAHGLHCGTGVFAPVPAVDDVPLGVGPITLELQRDYLDDTVTGRSVRFGHWLDLVENAHVAVSA